MRYALLETAAGVLAVGFDDQGVTRIVLPEQDWGVPTKAQLERAGLKAPAVAPDALRLRDVAAHLAGQPRALDHVPLSRGGVPDFLWQVLRAAQRIPPGETRTYGQLAQLAGSPNASRAVGQAMATNRWPIVVPCHRVFASTGFGQYSAGEGVHTKLRLLWREGYRGPTSNVGFDVAQARTHLIAADPALGAWLETLGPFTMHAASPRPRSGDAPFTALARAIIFQQLSTKAASTIYGRVAALLGDDTVSAPGAVLCARHQDLRGAGLSENKALSLVDLAKQTEAGKLPSRAEIERLDDEAVIARLTGVRGIGRWSAQMLLMFYLGRPDVLPVADLGVRKGYQQVRRLRRLPSEESLARGACAWAPYRSVGAWYMWRVLDASRLPTTAVQSS